MLSNSNRPTYRTTSTTYSSRPWRQALMLLVRLLPLIDQNLTCCAERTNAFTACSSSEDDHLSTPSISPHGVHCQRRGRCQIPWRMSTHLPTQRCKVSTMAANTNSHCLHSKSLAAPNTSNTTLALTKRTSGLIHRLARRGAYNSHQLFAPLLHRGGYLRHTHKLNMRPNIPLQTMSSHTLTGLT